MSALEEMKVFTEILGLAESQSRDDKGERGKIWFSSFSVLRTEPRAWHVLDKCSTSYIPSRFLKKVFVLFYFCFKIGSC